MAPPTNLPTLRAGYWISPNNHFFTVETHIDSICDSPDAFGTTENALREVFTRFGEPWRSEQRARGAIILTLLQYGWIRVRNYVDAGADRWSVNMPAINGENLARLGAFLRLLYTNHASYAPVLLCSMKGKEITTVQEIVDCEPTPGYGMASEGLPKLIYVSSPGRMPTAGIPEISLNVCYPEEC